MILDWRDFPSVMRSLILPLITAIVSWFAAGAHFDMNGGFIALAGFIAPLAVVVLLSLLLAPARIDKDNGLQIESLTSKRDELLENQKPKLEIVILNEIERTNRISDKDNTRTYFRVAVHNTAKIGTVDGIEVRLVKVEPASLSIFGARLNFANETPDGLRAEQYKWVDVVVHVVPKQDSSPYMTFFMNNPKARKPLPPQECTLTIEASGNNTPTVIEKFRFHPSGNAGEFILERIR